MKRFFCLLMAIFCLTGCASCDGTSQEGAPQPIDSPVTKLITTDQRRAAAEDARREMMSILWQVDQTLTYSYKVNSGDPLVDKASYVSTLEPGKIYSGLPYTHGSGDAVSFAEFGERMDNGVLRMHGLTQELVSGSGGMTKENNIARIGNDCADAVYAAWTVVSSSVTFPNAANMTPKHGCIPVGDYKTVSAEKAQYGITRDICKENGEEVMYAAYAQLQMADGLSVNTKGGAHAMLVSQVHVVKNGDQIDPEGSYVLVHEQTSKYFDKGETYYDENLGTDVYIMGGVDRKYTFKKLYSAGYLPVTCKEFIDEAPLEAEVVTDSEAGLPMTEETMFAGAFTCNYRIVSVTAEILDASGNVVQSAICNSGGADRNIFLLSRFENPVEQRVLNGEIDLRQLPSGTYTFRLTCRISTGARITAREFTITR